MAKFKSTMSSFSLLVPTSALTSDNDTLDDVRIREIDCSKKSRNECSVSLAHTMFHGRIVVLVVN